MKKENHRNYLMSHDDCLNRIIPQLDEVKLHHEGKVYLRLCSSIISQQLSVKVARSIHSKFLGLYEDHEPSLQEILDTDNETLRSVGFSRRKCDYVHNVCNFFLKNNLKDEDFDEMGDEEIIDLLSQIKGVGRWTVEMILIFTLGRKDVFPLDDLGIRNTMTDLYHIKISDKKKLNGKLKKISDKWTPYRTYATRYLWNWRDSGGL